MQQGKTLEEKDSFRDDRVVASVAAVGTVILTLSWLLLLSPNLYRLGFWI